MPGILPELKTRQDCDHLRERLGPGPVVALWATGHPLNTVDIMLYFRALLLQKGYTVLFLLKKKAIESFLESCPTMNVILSMSLMTTLYCNIVHLSLLSLLMIFA